ncbi:unnamed protein product [Effrenium voratum]|nr:unnamed protein product [Effrenium voratum]|mmetsp:Transcript_119500/g.283707  ORF Transcript_119500/g.283707 Transcript_119500/m.283707 type:complete len:188 (-) Transcript_119500:101-664(-)
MKICLLLTVALAYSTEQDWAEETAEEILPDLLLLLQVQQRLTRSEVNVSSLPSLPSLPSAEDSLPKRAVAKHDEQALQGQEESLKHWSAALLLSRSTSRLVSFRHSPDIIGEIVLTSVALLVWIFLMMLCSWLGFGGTNRLEEHREMERAEKHLPPEIHDPIDAAAAQLREAQKKQAQARKEKSACC